MIWLLLLYLSIGMLIDFSGLKMSIKDVAKAIDKLHQALWVMAIMLLSSIIWPYHVAKIIMRKK